MCVGISGELIKDLLPHFLSENSAQLVGGNLNRKIQLAALTDLNDRCPRPFRMHAGEEICDQLDRILCCRETDALRSGGKTGQKLAGREPIFTAHEGIQPFEREREMSAALV